MINILILLFLTICWSVNSFILRNYRFYHHGQVKAVRAAPSDPSLENDLFGVEGSGKAVIDEKDESVEPQGSGVGQLLEKALMLLGKAPKSKLREILLALPDEYSSSIPDESDDHEAHANAAMDALWKNCNGDWNAFSKILMDELKPVADETSRYMNLCVEHGHKLSEKSIKEMIVDQFGQESLPKIRTNRGDGRKYTSNSTLVKIDYLAQLIALLGEKCDNDYSVVADILENVSNKVSSKGFGK